MEVDKQFHYWGLVTTEKKNIGYACFSSKVIFFFFKERLNTIPKW